MSYCSLERGSYPCRRPPLGSLESCEALFTQIAQVIFHRWIEILLSCICFRYPCYYHNYNLLMGESRAEFLVVSVSRLVSSSNPPILNQVPAVKEDLTVQRGPNRSSLVDHRLSAWFTVCLMVFISTEAPLAS